MAQAPRGYVAARGLARWVCVLLVAAAISQVVSAALTWSLRSSAQDYVEGRIDEDAFVTDYAPSAVIAMLGGLVSVALVTVTIIWMFRVASNHRRLGRGGTWGPGWAIGGWFAPPFLFVIPFLMMRQLWRGSDPTIPPDDARWERSPVHPVVTVWWVLYGVVPLLLAPFGAWATFGNLGRNGTEQVAEQIADSAAVTTLSSAASVAAAAAFFVLVRRLTERQAALIGT